jgi:cob(I)alamin adenosyltransferase
MSFPRTRTAATAAAFMSIATKTGDDGSTSLLFGRRVSKTDPRVAACGACDELNAALGLVRAFAGEPSICNAVLGIQKELVALMGEMAVAPEDRSRYVEQGYPRITEAMVDALTAHIDDLEKNHEISYAGWATPGGTQGSAVLDVARTACRRAERAVCECRERGFEVSSATIRYLNRLSDLCWLWARFVETKAGVR